MRRPIVIVAALGSAIALIASCSACSPGYVMRAGWEEARILSARQPIEQAVDDTSLTPEIRHKLALVRQARVFAERRLGLDPGDSFESFAQLHRDTLTMVVSAAPELELRWKTWWFPIVGDLPYKGYFDFDAAFREAEQLAAEGYDTYVRPSAAFSTLGWLPDPVLSTALRGDSVSVVETAIHEITHTTWFPKGEARFNESFANFVGHVGAIEFFCDAQGDPEPCARARDRWHDVRVFARFFESLREALEALYVSDLPADEMRVEKRRIIDEAAARFAAEVAPELRTGRYRGLDAGIVDNAWLLSRLLYYSRLDDFDALYRSRGGLREAVEALIGEGDRRPPWEALDTLLADADGRAPAGAPTPPGE